MLAIRLRRHGAKRSPFYRIVVAEHANKRDGRFVEVIGHYNPRVEPEQVRLNVERFTYWQEKGAQPSDTVRTLLARQKGAQDEPQNDAQNEPQKESLKESLTAASDEPSTTGDSVAADPNTGAPSTPAGPADTAGGEQATS